MMPSANEIINELFPNLWVFIAHTLATISLLIILSKLVYEPFKRAMRKRRQDIKDILIAANEKQDFAEKSVQENIKILNNTKSKVSDILKNAEFEAEKNKDQIISEAVNESNEIINVAKKNIISENKRNNEKAKELVAKNSILIASKILETKLDYKDHKKLIDEFISDLDLNGEYDDR